MLSVCLEGEYCTIVALEDTAFTKYSHEVGYGLLALVVLVIGYLILKSRKSKKKKEEEEV